MDFLRSLIEAQSIDTQEVMAKLKAAEMAGSVDSKSNTKGYALEDDNGKIVTVRVPAEQGDDFEQALGKALNDREDQDVEIAEILFELRKQFDIVDVNWEDGSIPEDEETDNTLDEPVDGDVESPEGDFPGGEEGGDQLGGEDDDFPAPEGDAEGEDVDPMNADDTDVVGSSQAGDAFSALQSVIDMMKSDAEARKTEAEAEKAKASVEAGRVAAAAASARTRSEEEILDMENFNKRKKEEKRQRDLQAKIIRYRHETENNIGESFMGKLNEEMGCQFPDATPEEEEVLDMEKWEEQERERKQREKTHERLKKFRHTVKNSKSDDAEEEEEAAAPAPATMAAPVINTTDLAATFAEFLKSQADAGKKTISDIDLSHRVQR